MDRFLVAIFAFLAIAGTSCTEETSSSQQDVPVEPALVLTPSPSTHSAPTLRLVLPRPQRYFVNLDSVPFIRCNNFVGTAEIIDIDRVMTAAHVVGSSTTCMIGETVATVIENNPALDYAILSVATSEINQKLPYSCAGFRPGQTYYAIGYAHGRDFAMTRLIATARYEDGADHQTGTPFYHTRVLDGEVFQGMSGGPIVNQDGVMVGITSAMSIGVRQSALSRELKDTSICSSDK